MKILTVATDINNFILQNILIPSCNYFDFELIILKPLQNWNSHRMKDQFLKPYLDEVDPEEVVLFTDAYDVIILNDAMSLMTAFNEFNATLVFSSEINCWPEQKLAPVYEQISPNNNMRFLNSGGYVGKVRDILDILEKNVVPPSKILNSKYGVKGEIIAEYDEKYKWSN